MVQSYNYGGGYIGYIASNGKSTASRWQRTPPVINLVGRKVTYTNPIAVARNGGWRYGYGNMFYVELVSQYLTVNQVSGELAQKIMNEALKYQGWDYVMAGAILTLLLTVRGWSNGAMASGLVSVCRERHEHSMTLPSISRFRCTAGDLVFFHSTYNAEHM